MPLFEYKCPLCQHKFQHLVLVPRDWEYDAGRPCPECGEESGRVVSPGIIRFWGGGWMKPNVRKNF